MPTNSFEKDLKDSKIVYSYTERSQIHDYSGNWDLDGDGVSDGVRFVGNGGAHLQYTLSIELSSEGKEHSFPWIYTDSPLLESMDSMSKERDPLEALFPKFVVHDFNVDGKKDIYLNVGDYGVPLSKEFQENGLKSSRIVILYDSKINEIMFRDYEDLSQG